MRQLLINELSKEEVKDIGTFLDKETEAGGLAGMFWLAIPDNLLAENQQGHEKCGPFVFGIELGDDFAAFELLVRSRANLHCSCTSYAEAAQRDYLLAFMDRIISETGIKA